MPLSLWPRTPDGKYLDTGNQFALLTQDQVVSFLEYAASPAEAVQPGFPVPIGQVNRP